MPVYKFHGLDKHAATATARVIYDAAVRFYQFGNEFDRTRRRIEFTVFFRARSGIGLKEIFVYPPDEVFFMKTVRINLIDIIDQVFKFGRRSAQRGKEGVDRITVFIPRRQSPCREGFVFSISAIAVSRITAISLSPAWATI